MSGFRLGARVRFWLGYWLPSELVAGVAWLGVRRSRSDEPRAILVLLPEHIGDVVFTGPLLRALRTRFPAAHLIAAVAPAAAPLLEACPYVNQVVAWPPGLHGALRLGWRLRHLNCDFAIVPRADPDQAWAPLVAVLAGAPHRVTLTDAASGWGRFKRLQSAPFFSEAVRPPAGVRHERLRRLVLAWHFGVPAPDQRLESWSTEAEAARAAGFFSTLPPTGRRVAFGIGTSAPKHLWPAERFARLIEQLAAREPLLTILIAAPHERPQVEAIRSAARTPVYFLPDATLGETVAVLRGCALFVGNDSGPAHLAASTGLPVVVISSHPQSAGDGHPDNPSKCGPACAIARVVRPANPADADCSHGCVAANAHCILGVEVHAVAAAAWDALAASDRARSEEPVR